MSSLMQSGLAWLRSQLDAAGVQAVDTAEILVEEYTADGFGEPVATRVIERAGVPCQVRPLSAERLAMQGRDASRRMVRVNFLEEPFPVDDSRQRLVRVGGRVYRPVSALDLGSAGVEWRVDCELVTG